MSRDRRIVVIGMIVWAILVVGTAALPAGTFPNSIEPKILGNMPFSYLWIWVLSIAWFGLLPVILRDSAVLGSDE